MTYVSKHRPLPVNCHAEPRVSKDKLDDGARPTMADVARELGVAKITVSRALSDHSTVKESTRALIRQRDGGTPNRLRNAVAK